MTVQTAIQWSDSTWNPWMGCERVSPGCAHCYMFTKQTRYGHDPYSLRRSKTTFTQPLRGNLGPLVFTCSWSDWFHPGADEWRDEAWSIIRQTPHLTYQILTKRPELIADRLPTDWGKGWPNVWLGVSVELQRWLERARLLTQIPAAVRFLSCEPLLGPLDLDPVLLYGDFSEATKPIHWVIVGGESGPGARPCQVEWIRDIVEQCQAARVPVFVKQLGAVLGLELSCRDKKGGDMAAWPTDLRIREMPR